MLKGSEYKCECERLGVPMMLNVALVLERCNIEIQTLM